ncbi:hypothetical protein BC833DRAFT_649275 [Globomyces pollinis-pini]|nr:hypothetical protein BC833DRAFT_649275 [Globomyces pollinis-pini]
MTRKMQVKREQGEVTFNKENHSPNSTSADLGTNTRFLQEENAMLKKKLEEQNKKVVKLEERTKALQNTINKKNSVISSFIKQRYLGNQFREKINELVKSVKKDINIDGVGPVTLARLDADLGTNTRFLQEENAMLKKKLEEQNKKVVKLEERTKALQNTINKKNSVISSFIKQRYLGNQFREKINELVKSVKKDINIDGVGPVTLARLEFRHVVHFSKFSQITLKPWEVDCVREIYMLFLLCQDYEVPDVYWRQLITTGDIRVGKSKVEVNIQDVYGFFIRVTNWKYVDYLKKSYLQHCEMNMKWGLDKKGDSGSYAYKTAQNSSESLDI